MNRKALFTGLVIFLVVFAILPAANATVLDPMNCPAGNSTAVFKLYKEYNTTYHECYYYSSGLIPTSLMKKYNVSYSGIPNVLKNKPISNLTWAEAYYLAIWYSNSAFGKKYSLSQYNKVVDYANQMILLQNTSQSRALAYIVMSGAADSMYSLTNNPMWWQKETYFIVMFFQNNPDGVLNDGSGIWNSTWWPGLALEGLKNIGYNVPQAAIDFEFKATSAAKAGKLNTQEDLKRIGFYKWKKKYLIPIVHEKAPEKSIPRKIIDTIPTIQNFLSRYGSDMAKGIGGIFILGIVLLVLKRKRNNRYY